MPCRPPFLHAARMVQALEANLAVVVQHLAAVVSSQQSQQSQPASSSDALPSVVQDSTIPAGMEQLYAAAGLDAEGVFRRSE